MEEEIFQQNKRIYSGQERKGYTSKCLNCPQNLLCLHKNCAKTNSFFCQRCVEEKHEQADDHKSNKSYFSIFQWQDMIEQLQNDSKYEYENSSIMGLYNSIKYFQNLINDAMIKMLQKIEQQCPSISVFEQVQQYQRDSDYINNYSLLKMLKYDGNQQILHFKSSLQDIEIQPHFSLDLINTISELQKYLEKGLSIFRSHIEEINPEYKKYKKNLKLDHFQYDKNIQKDKKMRQENEQKEQVFEEISADYNELISSENQKNDFIEYEKENLISPIICISSQCSLSCGMDLTTSAISSRKKSWVNDQQNLDGENLIEMVNQLLCFVFF